MRVRTARSSDLPRVGELAAELVRQHHALDASRFMLIEPIAEGYRRFLGGELRRKGAVVLVAEAEEGGPDAIVGYAYATLEPRNWNDLLDASGKLNDVFVDPAARRRGVGRALCRAVLAELTARGAPRVVLMSAWRNPDAHVFFESLGFRRTMLEMTAELASEEARAGASSGKARRTK
ncbi:MAG TPA: GNAT family N-acetyltransferase [Polyangia bacterium]|nr:GNAT family N-acetyltransferase [Polyangia bacterium]